MWSTLRKAVRKLGVRASHGRGGGCPGANLPWPKGTDSPMRFTLFWLLWGVVGFGAPWLVVRHQMLRNVSYMENKKEEEEPKLEEDDKDQKK